MVTWKQLIEPNLDDNPKKPLYVYQNGKILTNWVGWCLAVCKAAFGATKSMGCALNAWNADPTKHKDYNLPEGVYCLIWWNGGYDKDGTELGHVAIAKRTGNNVKIWSSPYKKSATFTIFSGEIKSTINSLIPKYGIKSYLGWTEMICEKRVIKSETVEEKKPEDEKQPEPVVVPTPEPEPLPEPSNEPTEPIPTEPTNNNPKEDNMDNEPAVGPDMGDITGYIQEASKGINIPTWLKVVGYVVGDVFFLGSIEAPVLVNAFNATTPFVWATYMSQALLYAGIWTLFVVKLLKKK